MHRTVIRLGITGFLFFSSQMATAFEPLAYTVLGPQGRATVRLVTDAAHCPSIHWQGAATQTMDLRVAAARIPARSGGAQEQKEATFDVNTCEAHWPKGVQTARVGDQMLRAPVKAIKRIAVIADTGCRMKGSEGAFQDCNDPRLWPFAQVAQSASEKAPDLVIHIGDIHYRESPCPTENPGCTNSPWGYGFDAWEADFFKPARSLLLTAPWMFVRGNHEICSRAGQGWFRFIDPEPWNDKRSCNKPSDDDEADFTQPYAVAVNRQTQFVVFDSSRTANKPLSTQDPLYKKYLSQLESMEKLLPMKKDSIFLSHHPLLAVAPGRIGKTVQPGGNKSLLSVFQDRYSEGLFPGSVNWVMHGHIHAFESLSFASGQPASIVMGNAGSVNEGILPATLDPEFQIAKGAQVEHYASNTTYGFAILDLPDDPQDAWLLTEYDVHGQALLKCTLSQKKSLCKSP
jgi:hypothetical protein